MRILIALAIACACAALEAAQARVAAPSETATTDATPHRIVSLDACADQFVLGLADRAQIAALSPDAGRDFSYYAKAAKGLPQVRSSAEDVIALKPDLVVLAYGGGPGAAGFFQRAGVPVLEISFAEDFDGVRMNTRKAALAFGQKARGDAIIARFDERLRNAAPASGAAKAAASKLSALYMTQGGAASGSGSIVHHLIEAAGLKNYAQDRAGWFPIPLERLAVERPSIVAASFFGMSSQSASPWSPARHPAAQRAMRQSTVIFLPGAVTACSGWFIADAAEALAKARDKVIHAAP